jgi:hypothetical protein
MGIYQTFQLKSVPLRLVPLSKMLVPPLKMTE